MASGMTFEDGTTERIYTAADLDELGEVTFRLLMTDNTKVCRLIFGLQDNKRIGFLR